jgi:tripartite-type tricarboxylate transporter receptor subunit TctC
MIYRRGSDAMNRIALGFLLVMTWCATAWAQYPERPVRLLVPFPPGGGADILARLLAPGLQARLGQPVVVENRAGANGTIGLHTAAIAASDGYTIVLGHLSGFAVAPQLGKVAYDPIKDFAPVAMLAGTPCVLAVSPSFAAVTVKDVVDQARRASIAYGTPGTGNPNHLAGELFKSVTGVNMVHVPYKGAALVINDVIAGHIPVAFVTLAAAVPHIMSGKLRALGVTSAQRSAAAPDVPTMAEAGVAGVEVVEWLGVFAPSATPRPIVDRLAADIAATARTPELAKRLTEQGLEPRSASTGEFAAIIRSDIERLGRVIRQANIRAE